jgi:hypothetical protein
MRTSGVWVDMPMSVRLVRIAGRRSTERTRVHLSGDVAAVAEPVDSGLERDRILRVMEVLVVLVLCWMTVAEILVDVPGLRGGSTPACSGRPSRCRCSRGNEPRWLR